MKRLLFLAIVSFFYNCSNDLNDLDSPNSFKNELHQRVSFADFEAFEKKIDELSKLSNDELLFWVNDNNPYSLLNKEKPENDLEDFTLNNLPDAISALFNKDSELIIGNKIIWLDDESLYEFDIEDEENLNKLKSDTKNLSPIGKIELSFYIPKNDNNTSLANKVILNAGNHIDARHQHEFSPSQIIRCNGQSYPSSGIYKYVHELMTVRIVYAGNQSISYLYLRLKLEWYQGSNNWGVASEERLIVTNLSINSSLRYNGGYSYVPTTYAVNDGLSLNNTYYCSTNQTILLNRSTSTYNSSLNPQWHISISGTITHSLWGGGGFNNPVPPAPGLNTWVNNAVW